MGLWVILISVSQANRPPSARPPSATLLLRGSSALTSRRVYSTVTSKITWPPATPGTIWEFPLVERYAYENEDGVGRISGAPRHRGAQRGPSPGSHEGQGHAPNSLPQQPPPPRDPDRATGSGLVRGPAAEVQPLASAPIIPPPVEQPAPPAPPPDAYLERCQICSKLHSTSRSCHGP